MWAWALCDMILQRPKNWLDLNLGLKGETASLWPKNLTSWEPEPDLYSLPISSLFLTLESYIMSSLRLSPYSFYTCKKTSKTIATTEASLNCRTPGRTNATSSEAIILVIHGMCTRGHRGMMLQKALLLLDDNMIAPHFWKPWTHLILDGCGCVLHGECKKDSTSLWSWGPQM